MFGSIGGPELIVIFVLALLIFGPRKLPELGRMVGKGLSEFRRAASDLKESLEVEVAREDSTSRRPTALPGAPGAGPADETAPVTVPRDAAAPPAAGAPDETGHEKPH
jgi:sec-independent protein translocase protein TatA